MNLRELQTQIETAISDGLATIEDLHKRYSSLPFEQLQKIEQISGTVQGVKESHDSALTNIYNFVRQVNQQGGEAVRKLLDQLGVPQQ